MGGYWSTPKDNSNSNSENKDNSQSDTKNLNLWIHQTPDKFMDYIEFSSLNPIEWGKLDIIIDNEEVELKIGDNHLVVNKMIAPKIYLGHYNNREVIVKVSSTNDELQCLKYLNIFHPEISPIVYTYFKDLQGQEVIVMEKLEKFVYSIKNANILRSYIRRIQESKLYHGDITPWNIMQNTTGVPKLIGFGNYYGTPFYSQIKGIDEKYKDWQSLDRSLMQYKYAVTIHTVAKMDLQLLLDNQSFLEIISNSDETSMLRFLSEQSIQKHIQLNLIHWKTIYSMTQKYFLAIDFLKQKNKEISDLSLDSPEIEELSKYMDSIHISDEQFLDMVKATV
jgi:tRNA A-37 threonylcarbamoyl transferase component Bud32